MNFGEYLKQQTSHFKQQEPLSTIPLTSCDKGFTPKSPCNIFKDTELSDPSPSNISRYELNSSPRL
jgi:hypothetical protein